MTRALAESRAMKAQMLAENLATLDADYSTTILIDDTIEYLTETKGMYSKIAGKTSGVSNMFFIVGILVALVAGSGIDVPDNTVNMIACVVGIVIAAVGGFFKERD